MTTERFEPPPGLKSLIDCLGIAAKQSIERQLGREALPMWSIKYEPIQAQIAFINELFAKRKAMSLRRPLWAKANARAFDVAVAIDTLNRSTLKLSEPCAGSEYEVGAELTYRFNVWYVHAHAVCDKAVGLFSVVYGELLQGKVDDWEHRRAFTTNTVAGLRKVLGEYRDRLIHPESGFIQSAEEDGLLDAMVILGHFDVFAQTYYESRAPIIRRASLAAMRDQLLGILENEFYRSATDVLSLSKADLESAREQLTNSSR